MPRDPTPHPGDRRKHGRSLYTNAGCRCDICRQDNRRYQVAWKRSAVARTRVTGALPDSVAHGTPNAYYNHGCRCRTCRDVVMAAARERRARRQDAGVPATARHGTDSTYVNYRCRCDACREAHRLADSRRRAIRKRAAGLTQAS